MDEVCEKHRQYSLLLNKAEEEYKRRFGHYPSEVDDDWWIDSFHQTLSGSKVDDAIKSAKTRLK